MPKRRTHGSDAFFDTDDNPIGLTGAFAPIRGSQSVDYDTDDDPVGLTQAFGAVSSKDEPHAWDEAGKWKDFDWDAAFGEEASPRLSRRTAAAEDPDTSADSHAADVLEAKDASSSERKAAEEKADGKRNPIDDDDDDGTLWQDIQASSAAQASAAESEPEPAQAAFVSDNSPVPSTQEPTSGASKRGRHAAPEPELSPRMQKSQRTRRVLVVLVILLIVVIAAVAFFGYRTVSGSQQEAAQQAQEQTGNSTRHDIANAPADDAPDSTTKLADVPDLTDLLGKTQDQAIALLGRGALVTSNREVNEEGNPIKANLNVALTEEPADSKTGTPTVYLGLGEDGAVRQVGYSASASALGFGSLSFVDAVNNEHVVEKTLDKVGVKVQESSAVLPSNKDEYSTYASDGTTVVRERCSFEGDVDVNGIPCTWSAVLSYDYTTQVVTGNLNDTVRIIYVYITAK